MQIYNELAKNNISQQRRDLINHLFPYNIPQLWCALLTHYNQQGDAPTGEDLTQDQIKTESSKFANYTLPITTIYQE